VSALPSLRVYQRRGLTPIAVHRGAVDVADRIELAVAEIGEHGIPIHDELASSDSADDRSAPPILTGARSEGSSTRIRLAGRSRPELQ
jgi:hypothetical protein